MTSRSLLRFTSLLGLTLAVAACKVGSDSDGEDGEGGSGGKKGDENETSSAPFFLPTGEPDNTSAPSVEVDAAGRIHSVFPAYAGGRAYYAQCASDCSGSDEVKVVRFDTDATVANAMLALDGEGRLRVLLSSFNKVYYASCDAECGDAASWTQTELFDHGGDREVTGEALALDANGNPAFMMHTYVAYLGIGQKAPETFYVVANGDPHDPSAWSQHKVADQIWESSALRFDAEGRARLATVAHVVDAQMSTQLTAAYLECNGACDNEDSWVGTALFAAYENNVEAVSITPSISLALTSAGAPRIAVIGQDDNAQRRVVYYACNESCATGEGFAGMILSDLAEIGPGVDIALDGEDHVRVAYTLDYNIGLFHCDDADCTVENAGWDLAKVELSGEMDPDEIFLWDNCNVGAWFLHSPSVAIGPSGKPRVGYQARDISGGWSNPDPTKPDCQAGTDMTWSRLAMMGDL